MMGNYVVRKAIVVLVVACNGVNAAAQAPPEFAEGAAASYRAAHPELKVTRLDRSVDESFIAVRVDSAGRIFLGGREAVFVLEPNPDGTFAPRRELYRFPAHSWVGDIEIRGDDLYVATAAAIYQLPGARLKRTEIQPRKIVWGTPVDLHVTYHGLAFGPEGDLYFNSGDPLLNYGDWSRPDHFGHWTIFHGPNGESTPYTGVGAVFRCKPDGSDLKVVATGLRGSDGLCFSESWDLFTNDNDHESIPDRYTPYRILHVTPGADFGWPRGWAARRSPDRADLLDPINEGLGRGVPVGQCYYGDNHLPEDFHKSLLVAQWGHRNVAAYRLISKGASYEAKERPLLLCEGRARPVGVCVGQGGRVFVTIAYMAQNEGSPTYASDLVVIERDRSAAADTRELSSMDADELVNELQSENWSNRSAAHQEVLRRADPQIAVAATQLAKRAGPGADLVRSHIFWLPTYAALIHEPPPQPFAGLPGYQLSVIRQGVRRHGDDPKWNDFWLRCLRSGDDRLIGVALEWRDRVPKPLQPGLLHVAATTADRRVRQNCARLLARSLDTDSLGRLMRSEDASTRLTAILATGMRLTIPDPLAPLPAELKLDYRSENALFTVNYADATINLRDQSRVGSFTMAEYWKSVPHSDEQEKLFDMLMQALDDESEAARLQAAYYLSLLNDARSAPRIAAVTGEVEMNRLNAQPPKPVVEFWQLGPLDPSSNPKPESSAIDLSARFGVNDASKSWTQVRAENGHFAMPIGPGRNHYLYTRVMAQRPQRAILTVAYDDAITVWQNGRIVYENEVGVIPGFRNRMTLALISGSNDFLIRLRGRGTPIAATCTLQALDGTAAVLPENLGIAGLADRLRSSAAGDAAVPEDFLRVDWPGAIAKGDVERGRKLFGADGIGCAKCHAVAPGDAGAGAPSLAEAGQRFTVAHLVESVLTPSRQVAPVFEGAVLALKDGRVVSGLITNTTADTVEVLLPDATKQTLSLREIDERKPMSVSTMPANLVKTPDELADILAYLVRGAAPAR